MATVSFSSIGNNGITLADGPITDSATTLNVTSAAALTLDDSTTLAYLTLIQRATWRKDPLVTAEYLEVVKVTAVSTNALTIVRAQDGTTALAFADADVVELRHPAIITSEITDALTDGTAELNIGGAALSNDITITAENAEMQLIDPTLGVTLRLISEDGWARVGTSSAHDLYLQGHGANKLQLTATDIEVLAVLDSADTTETSSGTTGAIHTDGGIGVSKKLWVGTDATVGGNIIVTGTVDGRDVATDGTTLDDLPVSNLANGTEGELITWDAAGAPATVAVGTATHVLTSNGIGVAPTFQAGGGGGGGLSNIVEDTNPQLGGDLDLNSSDITGTGNINNTGTITSSSTISGVAGTFSGAVSGTTVTASGIVSVDDVTDTTSAVTGSVHTDGGLGIAKALWVGTTAKIVGLLSLRNVADTFSGIFSNTNTADRTYTLPDTTGTVALTSTDTKQQETFVISMSDETTALTTGIKATFYMPYAFTITEVQASVTTAPTDATLIVDIHEAGTTIMATNKLDILTTATLDDGTATVSDTTIAADAKLEFEIDQIGSTVAGAGLKVTIIGTRT